MRKLFFFALLGVLVLKSHAEADQDFQNDYEISAGPQSEQNLNVGGVEPVTNQGGRDVKSSGGILDDYLLELKAAYFLPTGDRFKNVYGGSGIYGLEFTFQAKDFLYVWTSADFYLKSGHAYGSACTSPSSTDIWFLPFAAGIKLFCPINIVDLWLGGGILGTYVNVKDHNPNVISSISKWGVGGIVKAGAIINCTKYFFLDLFTDYSFMQIPFHDTRKGTVIPHKADLSGWSFGGSIGFRFGERYTRSK